MILFQKIRWKNFLSTGAHYTEINFTKSPNTLIIGQNGAGKSTILDALCFSLFGKPFRKINKPQLLNSINAREGVVEIEFNIVFDGNLDDTFTKEYLNNPLIPTSIIQIGSGGEWQSGRILWRFLKEHYQYNDEDIIYFLEDDYLHKPGWVNVSLK